MHEVIKTEMGVRLFDCRTVARYSAVQLTRTAHPPWCGKIFPDIGKSDIGKCAETIT